MGGAPEPVGFWAYEPRSVLGRNKRCASRRNWYHFLARALRRQAPRPELVSLVLILLVILGKYELTPDYLERPNSKLGLR